MGVMASQITSLTFFTQSCIQEQIKESNQSSPTLAFARGIHRGPVNSPHKGPVTRKMFPFDGVIMKIFVMCALRVKMTTSCRCSLWPKFFQQENIYVLVSGISLDTCALPDSIVREFGALHVHILCAKISFQRTTLPLYRKILMVPIAHMRNAQVLGLFCRIEYGVAVFLQHCSTYSLYSSDFIQPQVKSPSIWSFGRKFSLGTHLCSLKMLKIYRQINIICFSNVILRMEVLSPQPNMMIWLYIKKSKNIINRLYRFGSQIFVPQEVDWFSNKVFVALM